MIQVEKIFFGTLFFLLLAGCVPQTATSSAVQEIAISTTPPEEVVAPTAELPSISVYELIDGSPVPVVEGTSPDLAVIDDSGLPAPVVSGTGGGAAAQAQGSAAGQMPTAVPTVPPPTATNSQHLTVFTLNLEDRHARIVLSEDIYHYCISQTVSFCSV